ncbi:set-domain histone methyltransferase-5 [Diaporthe helianthi]|uniref:Set-domain histone methyltransferase-5 n=1 Tax=Diaporthe helianthi TaxID=158607 RepID=A0A2P5I491_DIAHE|nr:set-domain histone methyltransferase-5 [Diaporthe helianthi]
MATLPDPNSLPHFQWIDETGRTRPLDADVREITDYVMNYKDWPSAETTVDSVLTRTVFDLKCEVCGKKRDTCKAHACVEYFHSTVAVTGKSMCDIKGAGGMGKGVFANRKIPNGTIIGEYLGRLYPMGHPDALDRYLFMISEVAEACALQFGNVTRFFNHHCFNNITPRLGMYGRRPVILYEANRDIDAGEQLYVDYGAVYFSLPGNPCRCDAKEGDHVPSKRRSRAGKKSEARAKVRTSVRTRKSTRITKGISGKKHGQDKPAAVLKDLTRSSRVSRRYGPQVYTSGLRGNLNKKYFSDT